MKGHRIRAGSKWELEGDRSSGFFFKKIQKRRAKRTMEALLDKTGALKTTKHEMKRVVQETFTEVFASSGPSPDWLNLWSQHEHLLKPKVTNQQRALLKRQFTIQELDEALQELPTGKSPGHEGTPQEFFVLF